MVTPDALRSRITSSNIGNSASVNPPAISSKRRIFGSQARARANSNRLRSRSRSLPAGVFTWASKPAREIDSITNSLVAERFRSARVNVLPTNTFSKTLISANGRGI